MTDTSTYDCCKVPMSLVPAGGRYGAETLWTCYECGHQEPASYPCEECGQSAGDWQLCRGCALEAAEALERALFRLLDAQNTPPFDHYEGRHATLDEWPEDPELDARVDAAERELGQFVHEHAVLLRDTRFNPPRQDEELAELGENLRAAPPAPGDRAARGV